MTEDKHAKLLAVVTGHSLGCVNNSRTPRPLSVSAISSRARDNFCPQEFKGFFVLEQSAVQTYFQVRLACGRKTIGCDRFAFGTVIRVPFTSFVGIVKVEKVLFFSIRSLI